MYSTSGLPELNVKSQTSSSPYRLVAFIRWSNCVGSLYVLAYNHTTEQPMDRTLTTVEIKDLLGHLEPGWFQKVIVSNYYFNSLMGIIIIIIVVVLNALQP
jgi:hypothetical protein